MGAEAATYQSWVQHRKCYATDCVI